MKIQKLRIRNVLGVELLELDDLGELVQIHGANGSGKSSILKAISLAFGGKKSDEDLLRSGAKEGEVYLVLDDGTTIQRKIDETGAKPAKVKEPKFGAAMRGAETYLKGLLGAGWSPIDFLQKRGRDRVSALLEAMPITVEGEKVGAILETCGLEGKDFGPALDLDQLDMVTSNVYEHRRNCNVRLTEAKHAAQSLAETLEDVPEDETKAEAELASSRDELELARAQISDVEKEARERLHAARADVETKYTAAVTEAKAEYQKAVDAAKTRLEDALESFQETRTKALGGAQKKHELAIAKLHEEWDDPVEALKERVTRLEEQRKAAQRAGGQRDVLKDLEHKRDKLAAAHEQLDEAYDRLLTLKKRLLEKLPIEGIEIKNGELWVTDGKGELRPFDKVNTAEQIKFAIRLGTLQLGELRAVVVDNLEALDPEHRKLFLEEAAKTGVQFFLAFADEGPLSVEA